MSESKIQKILAETGDSVLNRRAGAIAKDIGLAYTAKINTLERIISVKENELENTLDMSVKTSDSLTPGIEGFNAENWIQKRLDLQLELKDLNESLEILNKDKQDLIDTTTEELTESTKK
jgi:hypothetical protein